MSVLEEVKGYVIENFGDGDESMDFKCGRKTGEFKARKKERRVTDSPYGIEIILGREGKSALLLKASLHI